MKSKCALLARQLKLVFFNDVKGTEDTHVNRQVLGAFLPLCLSPALSPMKRSPSAEGAGRRGRGKEPQGCGELRQLALPDAALQIRQPRAWRREPAVSTLGLSAGRRRPAPFDCWHPVGTAPSAKRGLFLINASRAGPAFPGFYQPASDRGDAAPGAGSG